MPNTLLRSGRVVETPAVAPRAYQPAYTSYITEKVQTITDVTTYKTVTTAATTRPGSWAYTYVPDPNNSFQQIRQLVWIPGSTTPGSTTTIPVASQAITVTTRVTPVYHPEEPAIAGSPARRAEFPPQGWTSFARSVSTLPGTGSIVFRIKAKVTGVAVGYAAANAPAPVAGYTHLRDGLLFTDGKVARLVDGISLGTYVESDVFTITRKRSGVVAVLRNGSQISTYSSPVPADELSNLSNMGVAMYAVSDALYDPAFTGIAGASGAMTLPMLSMFARQGTKSQATMALPAMSLTARGGFGGQMTFPPLSMFASDSIQGQTNGALPGITLLAYGGTLPVVLNNGADLYLNALIMSGVSLTGETGTGAMTLPVLTLMAANRVYGGAVMGMPPLVLRAWDEPANEAFAFEVAELSSPTSASTVLIVLALDGAVIASVAVPTVLIDALAQTDGAAASTAFTSQLLDALAMSFANFGDTVMVPGLGADTWVYNPASQGTTKYPGYGFNSFARIGDRHYGANETGVYALEGDTDSGEPIRAVIGLGERNFGSAMRKTVVNAYIGMSGEGNLVLKVIAEGSEYLYATRSFSEAMKQQRFDLGRGLRTNYVTLELFNTDGNDFEIDTLEFLVADLTRRI